VAELLVGTVYLLVDVYFVRREALPESWTKIQLVASTISGPLLGYLSTLFAPHRLGNSVPLRVVSWIALPLLGGTALAVFNYLAAEEDRAAAWRLGWVCGILFAVGFLAARRWGIG
jgi:hypothetical protein